MKLFYRLLLVATIGTYLLVFVGGLVRASGAGLGCPDWPHCYGRLIPPTSQAELRALIASGAAMGGHEAHGLDLDPSRFNVTLAWIEYINRLIGALIGLLIVAAAVAATAPAVRRRRDLAWPAWVAVPLVAWVAWLGALVVRSELSPAMLSAHMGLALVLASVLTLAVVRAGLPAAGQPAAAGRGLAWWVAALWVLTVLQVSLGAGLRGEVTVVERAQPGLASLDVLAAVGAVKHAHLALGLVVFVGALLVAVRATVEAPRLPAGVLFFARLNLALLCVQVAMGMGFGMVGMQPLLRVYHLWVASIVIGLWVVLYLRLRAPVPASEEQAALAGRPTGLPYVVWTGAGAATMALLAAVAVLTVRSAEVARSVLPYYGAVPAFRFAATPGGEFGAAELKGKVTVLCFMFTRCTTICPVQTAEVGRLYDAMQGLRDVQFVSVSVDPEYDTLEVLAAYGAKYGARDARWQFARGPLAEAQALAAGLSLRSDFPNHSPKLVLIDPDGQVRGYYDSMRRESVDLLLEHVPRLLRDFSTEVAAGGAGRRVEAIRSYR